MLISIIIPVYNTSDFLSQCIESVIGHPYNNIEVLLINDGSTDQSGLICNEYAEKDNRIKVIHQKNQGLSAARNTGIRHATGEYIYFIDSDDFLEKFDLQKVIDNISMSLTDIYYINFTENKSRDSVSIEDSNYLYSYNLEEFLQNVKFTGHVIRMFIKKSILIDNHIFFDEGKLMEDIAFTIDTLLHSRNILYDDRALYRYYMNPNSILRKKQNSEKNYVYFRDLVFAIKRIENSIVNSFANKSILVKHAVAKKIEELTLFMFLSFAHRKISYAQMLEVEKSIKFKQFKIISNEKNLHKKKIQITIMNNFVLRRAYFLYINLFNNKEIYKKI